jgi:hypothetical protein
MEPEYPAMRERLVALKLQREQMAKEIGELQNRMASSTPTITPEKVTRVGGLLRDKLHEGPPEFRQPTPGCSWTKSGSPTRKSGSAARNLFWPDARRKASPNPCQKFSLLFRSGAPGKIKMELFAVGYSAANPLKRAA